MRTQRCLCCSVLPCPVLPPREHSGTGAHAADNLPAPTRPRTAEARHILALSWFPQARGVGAASSWLRLCSRLGCFQCLALTVIALCIFGVMRYSTLCCCRTLLVSS